MVEVTGTLSEDDSAAPVATGGREGPPLVTRSHIEVALFRVAYVSILLGMLLPLFIVVSTSFNPTGVLAFPPEGLSLRWYREFIQSTQWLRAFVNSMVVATGTAVISLVLGTAAAYGVRGLSARTTGLLIPLLVIPLLIPPIVIAITLVVYLSFLNLYQTYLGIMIAHSLWASPLVFFIMQAVFSRFDWSVRDAALDLGATPTRAFREVVYPQVKSGILAAGVVAFIISLQEFVMALFLSGYSTRTVPVLAWNSLRRLLDPLVSVVSTMLMVLIVLFLLPVVASMGISWLARQLS
jgi:ABC-type spermidine/putrescine transport system permease subunit II